MSNEPQNKRYTPLQAKEKIVHYCAWQERCHYEVAQKLYSFGLNSSEVNEIISFLITENYLNEERFAIQYAGGKFRMNQWGKSKIKQALRQKRVSDYCIRKGLETIDENDYALTFERLKDKKLISLKSEKNIFTKKRKLQDYLLQKGYEFDLIQDALKQIG